MFFLLSFLCCRDREIFPASTITTNEVFICISCIKKYFPFRPGRRRGIESKNRKRRYALTAAGFPNESESFPLSHIERNIIHCRKHAFLQLEFSSQVLDAEQDIIHQTSPSLPSLIALPTVGPIYPSIRLRRD